MSAGSDSLEFQAKKALLALLTGAVPERREEVLAIWDHAVAGVDVVPDTDRILFSTHQRRIRLSLRAIDICWVVGFSSASALISYGPYVRIAIDTGQTIEDVSRSDENRYEFESAHREAIHMAQELIGGNGTPPPPWPPGIPQMKDDRSALSSDFDRVIYDVTILALAFVILHELRHAMFQTAGDQPSLIRDEESACDLWAKEFLLSRQSEFAQDYGHDDTLSKSKRALGLAVGTLIIHELTPMLARGGNTEYFSVGDRTRKLISDVELPDSDMYWTWVSSLLIGIHRRASHPLSIGATTPKMLAVQLLDAL